MFITNLSEFVRFGELDNREPGTVAGWLDLIALGRIEFRLKGDFGAGLPDLRLRFIGGADELRPPKKPHPAIRPIQVGNVTTIDADGSQNLAIEWESDGSNFRIVVAAGGYIVFPTWRLLRRQSIAKPGRA